MRKLLVFLFFPAIVSSQIPSGYYDGTEGKTGYSLKNQLHQIISQKNISWHYGDLPTYYATTDVDKYYENNGSLLDIYSEQPLGADAYEYTFDQMIGSATAEGQGYNREHLMPQSTFYSNYPMYSDLFFVVPTDARINQLRSNYPYGIGGGSVSHTFTNSSKISNSAIPNSPYTGKVFEPIDEFKGDIARTLLYFIVRYEGKLGGFKFNTTSSSSTDQNPMNGTEEQGFEKWYLQMLLSWSNLDPVSQREIDRNNEVYNIQGNRNPFIDHPEWINLIWNQSTDSAPPQSPSNLIISRTSAYFIDLQWQASPDSDILGYEIYQNGSLVAKTTGNQISIDHLQPNTTYTLSIRAYDNGYFFSPQTNTVSTTTLANDVYSRDLQISKYLEGNANNKALEIVNLTGHKVNLQGYKLGIQYKGSSNYYFAEPLELEGNIAHGEKFVVINPHADLSCFNTADAKFISASPAVTFNGSNYVELNHCTGTVDAIGTKDIANNLYDKSLYRLSTVKDPSTTFNPNEWEQHPADYCVGLGNPLSTTEITTSSTTTIYPNPAKDVVHFSSKDKIEHAQILDSTGKLILDTKPTNSQINIQNLPEGIYFVKTKDKIFKLIKTK